MITPVQDPNVSINLEDGRYMVFSQVISPEGRVLGNLINVVDVKDMTEFDNMIQVVKTANDIWDDYNEYSITGIVKILEQ